MPSLQVELAIMVNTALSVGGSGARGALANKSLLRDAWDRPFLPGSQVKGRVRHVCEALARVLYPQQPICQGPRPELTCPQDDSVGARTPAERRCMICEIFGSTFWPSPLRFHNLIHDPECPVPIQRTERFVFPPDLRPGIGIDRRRRVVREQLLFDVETTSPGTHPVFHAGQAITGDLRSLRHAALLLAGIQLCNRWGAGKSRGLGWSTTILRANYDGQTIMNSSHEEAVLMNWEVLRA
jgi:CRISPR/Cas system CSM-associated protein Csm3 (group 7 of RAMP superfamily)